MSPNTKFNKQRERFVFISAPLIANPARQLELMTLGHSLKPVLIIGPRTTYMDKRNQMKRERRVYRDKKLKRAILSTPIVRHYMGKV